MKRVVMIIGVTAVAATVLSGCNRIFNRGGSSVAQPVIQAPQTLSAPPVNIAIPQQPFSINPVAPLAIQARTVPAPIAPMAAPAAPALVAISSAKVLRNEKLPDQLVVDVVGTLPNGCTNAGPVDYKTEGMTFKYTIPAIATSPAGACADASPKPFNQRFAVNGAGQKMAPGKYSLEINNLIQPIEL